jgi:beta-lactamase class D
MAWNAVLIIAILIPSTTHAKADFARLFAGRDGCFELYDLKTNKLVVRYNPSHCGKRVSPASIFKVPLALMAFDVGILKNERSAMKWDGTKTTRKEWNRDQTAASWMRNSVVWFSQRLTPRLGMRRVKSYLARFNYGNKDMSGGITKAWLQSSLLISPDEQLRFWRRFWREDLPVSRNAFDMTKRITLVGRSRSGWTLHGKTGSGAMVSEKGKLLRASGWFVGHVARGNREYVFVTHYTDRAPPTDRRPPGWIAREITTRALGQMGLY